MVPGPDEEAEQGGDPQPCEPRALARPDVDHGAEPEQRQRREATEEGAGRGAAATLKGAAPAVACWLSCSAGATIVRISLVTTEATDGRGARSRAGAVRA